MNASGNFVIKDSDISSLCSVFQNLNNEQLKSLLNDDSSELIVKVDEMIKNFPQVSVPINFFFFLNHLFFIFEYRLKL